MFGIIEAIPKPCLSKCMDLTPSSSGSTTIERYGDGGFRVGGVRYEGALCLGEDGVQSWECHDVASLSTHDAEVLFAFVPGAEIWIIGCGGVMQMVPSTFKAAFRTRNIAVEAMDTAAACRTYNVLVSEGRKVAAALITV